MSQYGFDFDQSPPDELKESGEPEVLTVSKLNAQIRGLIEGEFTLVWLQGEISNFKAHTSGHFYFSLKDKKSQISAVMFRGFNSRLKFRPETGQEVIVRGRVTVYEPRGNYQIFCESMEPVGAGALQMAFNQLKEKLQKEGLFAAERKRPLPSLPKHIALVTSPTGAAVKDILNVLRRRFRGVQVTIVPTLVQGAAAAPQIVKAIEKASRIKGLDAMIVGRGGGSTEDLWCFNDEKVARAIVASPVPIVSAVGHEVDFTIADFVADLRAPTPSAAAELVVKNAADLIQRVESYSNRLVVASETLIENLRFRVVQVSKRLKDPKRHLQDLSLRADELIERLEKQMRRELERYPREISTFRLRMKNAISRLADNRRSRFQKSVALLESLSPLKVVERGYSIVTMKKTVIKDSQNLSPGQKISLRFAKGTAEAEILSTKPGVENLKE